MFIFLFCIIRSALLFSLGCDNLSDGHYNSSSLSLQTTVTYVNFTRGSPTLSKSAIGPLASFCT